MRRVAKERYVPFLIALALFVLVLIGFSVSGFYAEIQANPDLTPTAVSYSPLGPQTGDTVTFSVTVANNGGGGTGSPFDVGLYIDNVNVANGTMAALGAGASGTVNITWTATSELHDVYVYADVGNVISETNENNNRLNSSIGVDWSTQQQNNERTGYANTIGPTTNNVLWSRALAPINGYSIIAADGNVYTGTRDYVVALKASTGATAWSYTVGSGYQYPDAKMTVANGVLYTGTDNTDNKIWAFNASTGSIMWSKASGSGEPGFAAYYQGIVYDSNPGTMQTRDPSDGSLIWSSSGYTLIGGSPVITNDALYFVTYNYTAASLNAFSGANKWMRDMGSVLGMTIYGPPAYAYGNLYFGTSQGSGTEVLYSLRASDGATNWSLPYNQYSGTPIAIFNGTVFVGAGNNVYARDALSGNAVWTTNLGGGVISGPVVSSNGIVYAGAYSSPTKIYALNAADGSIIWQYTTNGGSYALALYNSMLFATTENGRVYAFGPQPTITSSQAYNNTIVDRDSVDNSVADAVPLTVNLSNGASGVTVNFYGHLTEPAAFSGDYSIGSNTSVNGVATYVWNPPSDGSIPAGRYVWKGNAIGYNTLDNSTVRVYGGLIVTFKGNTTKPNTVASYQSGDTVEVDMKISSTGSETIQDLLDSYNAAMTATLMPPTQAPITLNFNNTTTTEFLATGTANSSCDGGGGDYYLAINEHLVPSAVPEGPYCGGVILGYNLSWTCSVAACPSESGKRYVINDSDGTGGCGGSWWTSPSYDWLMLRSFPIYNSSSCPGNAVAGWTFNVTGPVRHWYGNYTLATETGTWTAVGNATANYFFTNSTSRTFTVAGAPSTTPVQQGGGGIFRNITAEAKNNISIEAGVNTLNLGRGTSEHVDIFVENTGSVVLQDVYVEAKGMPYGWVTISPSKIDSLGQNEKRAFNATINIPDQAGTGKYSLVFTVHNYYTRAEIPVELTVSAQCERCPVPGEWSACADGKMSRAAYRCGSQTDYKCEQWIEEQKCVPPQIVNNAPLLIVVTVIGAAVLQRFYFRKKPAAPVPQELPEEGQPSPAFAPS
jgi:outer membrane protein assembly factor BamB